MQECIGYDDSDYAGNIDKRWSTTGYVFTLSQAPVSWHSTLQSIVTLSTTEAEYVAMTEAMKKAIWFQRLLDNLGIDQDLLKINYGMSAIYLQRTRYIMQERSTSTSGSTLFGRFLRRVTSSCRRFTRRRILPICLPRLFRE